MNTNTKNYGAKSNIRLFFIFGFFIISKKNLYFYFWPGGKKNYGGEGEGVSVYDMWKYTQNH